MQTLTCGKQWPHFEHAQEGCIFQCVAQTYWLTIFQKTKLHPYLKSHNK